MFTPEQFKSRPGIAQVERDLKKWLIGLEVSERVDFIKKLWFVNYRFSLVLLQGAQLPVKETENLYKYYLDLGHHNTVRDLIKRIEPMLGERKFWRIAAEQKLTPVMKDFLNYHSHGRLDAEISG